MLVTGDFEGLSDAQHEARREREATDRDYERALAAAIAKPCRECDGKGRFAFDVGYGYSAEWEFEECSACGGTGSAVTP